MLKWGDLFNSRQKLALITFTEKVRLAYKKMLEEGYDKDYAKAVVSYLGIFINSLLRITTLCRWANTGYEKVQRTFSRQALPMVWDYVEVNPFSENVRDWMTLFTDVIDTPLPPHPNPTGGSGGVIKYLLYKSQNFQQKLKGVLIDEYQREKENDKHYGKFAVNDISLCSSLKISSLSSETFSI
jgi:hypothetical protein